MGQPAAKAGDEVRAEDTHEVIVPGPAKALLKHQFAGILRNKLSPNVRISKCAAATVDSIAINAVAHIPLPPGVTFQKPPANQGTISQGSSTVRINHLAAARNGDSARTCNDPADADIGKVVASGTVRIG